MVESQSIYANYHLHSAHFRATSVPDAKSTLILRFRRMPSRSHPDSGRRAKVVLDKVDLPPIANEKLIIGKENLASRIAKSQSKRPSCYLPFVALTTIAKSISSITAPQTNVNSKPHPMPIPA